MSSGKRCSWMIPGKAASQSRREAVWSMLVLRRRGDQVRTNKVSMDIILWRFPCNITKAKEICRLCDRKSIDFVTAMLSILASKTVNRWFLHWQRNAYCWYTATWALDGRFKVVSAQNSQISCVVLRLFYVYEAKEICRFLNFLAGSPVDFVTATLSILAKKTDWLFKGRQFLIWHGEHTFLCSAAG